MRFLALLVIAITLTSSSSLAKEPLVDELELKCLTKVILHEARGEPFKGQVAVAHVVRNRVMTSKKSYCSVVYQPFQFTDIKKSNLWNFKKSSPDAYKQARQIAKLVMVGLIPDPTKGAKFYYAHKKIRKPRYLAGMEKKAIIGGHTFYD